MAEMKQRDSARLLFRLVMLGKEFTLLSPFGWHSFWSHSPPIALVLLSAHIPLSSSQADTANLLVLPLKIPTPPINHNSDSVLDQCHGLQNSTSMKLSDTSLRIPL